MKPSRAGRHEIEQFELLRLSTLEFAARLAESVQAPVGLHTFYIAGFDDAKRTIANVLRRDEKLRSKKPKKRRVT
mgnify:FL=1